MVINRFEKMGNEHGMYFKNKKITWEHSVKLLGIEIDNQLNSDSYVSTLCKKAGSSLMLLVDLQNTLIFQKKKLW